MQKVLNIGGNMQKKEYYNNIIITCLKTENKIELLNKDKSIELIKDKQLLESINDCLIDLFCRYGLEKNDEPNRHGYILEEVIDYVNNLIYKLE